MKKFLIASGVAVLAFTSVVGAQTFSTNLTVGSQGADVVALQTALISAGFNIPAISAGTAKGYFGSQTQAAVKLYQASKGVPNTGFVGPLTRAALNGGGSMAVNPSWTCPAGMICTPIGGTTPVVNTNPGSITTPGIAGTLAFSLQSTPSNGTSVDKGQSADVVRYKLQAGASDMAVSSLALDFSTRAWLTIGSVVIKDDSGAVIAQKTGLTANDFTEITVGTDYRLYVPVSTVVPKTITRYLTVAVTMLPITDQCTSGCNIYVTKAQIRSVDGTGVTDTQTVGDGTTGHADARYFNYTGSNNGSILATSNTASPRQGLVQVSTSNETKDVLLAVFDLKSQNRNATLQALNVYIHTNGTALNTLFADVQIQSKGLTYSANTTSVTGDTTASSTYSFTNLQIPLEKDAYTSIRVVARVPKDTNGTTITGAVASTTLKANATNVNAIDTTYNTVSVNAGTIVSNDLTFSSSAGSIALASQSFSITDPGSNSTGRLSTTLWQGGFTILAGSNGLYLAKDGSGITRTYAGVAVGSTTQDTFVSMDGSVGGDTSTFYFVAPGSSRAFALGGSINNTNGTSGTKSLGITKIAFSDDTTNAGEYWIDYGLEGLNSNLAKGVLLGTQAP